MNQPAMNKHPASEDTHRAIQELLPWFAANSLTRQEKNMLQQHLASCTQCQSELAWHQALREHEPQAAIMPDVDAAFAKLLPRLQPEVQSARQAELPVELQAGLQAGSVLKTNTAVDQPAPGWLASLKSRLKEYLQQPGRDWAMATIACQFVLIAGLGMGLVFQYGEQDGRNHEYRALSAASGMESDRHADGDIAVSFKPSATIREIQKSLHASGARIIDGPTIADVYILSVPTEQYQQALQTLSAEAHVASVASLKAGATK